jgi:hypothetical protein
MGLLVRDQITRQWRSILPYSMPSGHFHYRTRRHNSNISDKQQLADIREDLFKSHRQLLIRNFRRASAQLSEDILPLSDKNNAVYNYTHGRWLYAKKIFTSGSVKSLFFSADRFVVAMSLYAVLRDICILTCTSSVVLLPNQLSGDRTISHDL